MPNKKLPIFSSENRFFWVRIVYRFVVGLCRIIEQQYELTPKDFVMPEIDN